jgi:hypothetical protein
MIVYYRRVGSKVWEEAILLGAGYWPGSWFILRWDDDLFQDFSEVCVPKSRILFPSETI